jgi:hypothetical protein
MGRIGFPATEIKALVTDCSPPCKAIKLQVRVSLISPMPSALTSALRENS